jgi:hypothetical protein
MSPAEREECPACGGAGGGPFGRANSGWDIETYECPRCGGRGYILEAVGDAAEAPPPPLPKPGIVKTSPETRAAAAELEATKKRRASGA